MPGEFSADTRRLIRDRDDDRCVMCARPLMGEGHLHHRQLRSQGGKHDPSNGVLMCALCHGYVHSHVRASYESGFIVPSWDDPAQVPVTSWRGRILLKADATWALADADQVSGNP